MTRVPPPRAAGVVIYTRDGPAPSYLLLRNARHGTWGFPKGHLEPGESDLEGALRELAEETGIADVELDPAFREELVYPVRTPAGTVAKTVVYYLGRVPARALQRSDEHDLDAWLDFHQALARLQHANLREVLRRAHAAVDGDGSR